MTTRYWCVTRQGETQLPFCWVEDQGSGDYRVRLLKMPGDAFHSESRIEPIVIHRLPTLEASLNASFMTSVGASPVITECTLGPGEYMPRIWRPNGPSVVHTYHDEFNSAMHAASNLFAGMIEVFRFVEPTPKNAQTYSHQIRQLLVLACMEVEAQCKAVLRANNYHRLNTKTGKVVPEKSWNIGDDFSKLAKPLRLAEWDVELHGYRWTGDPFGPFEAWGAGKPVTWYQAYNKVKHDREIEFERATLENLISAMGAVFILVHAQFGQWGRETMPVPSPFWPWSVRFEPHERYLPVEFLKDRKSIPRTYW